MLTTASKSPLHWISTPPRPRPTVSIPHPKVSLYIMQFLTGIHRKTFLLCPLYPICPHSTIPPSTPIHSQIRSHRQSEYLNFLSCLSRCFNSNIFAEPNLQAKPVPRQLLAVRAQRHGGKARRPLPWRYLGADCSSSAPECRRTTGIPALQ